MILPRIVRVSWLSNENAVLNSPPRVLSAVWLADYETEIFHFKSRKHKLTRQVKACGRVWGRVFCFLCVPACLFYARVPACCVPACCVPARGFDVLFFLFSFCSFFCSLFVLFFVLFFCSFFVFFVFFFIIFNFFTMCARVERLLI